MENRSKLYMVENLKPIRTWERLNKTLKYTRTTVLSNGRVN